MHLEWIPPGLHFQPHLPLLTSYPARCSVLTILNHFFKFTRLSQASVSLLCSLPNLPPCVSRETGKSMGSEFKCLGSNPLCTLGMLFVLVQVHPEADPETRIQVPAVYLEFQKIPVGEQEVKKGRRAPSSKENVIKLLPLWVADMSSHKKTLRNSE